MAAYITFGVSPAHLLSASVMSAPAALAYGKLFYPETEESLTSHEDIKLTKEGSQPLIEEELVKKISNRNIIFIFTLKVTRLRPISLTRQPVAPRTQPSSSSTSRPSSLPSSPSSHS